jgi:hypothetical protein
MSTIKKISSIGLSVTTAVWLSGAIMPVLPVAQAATVEELQVQIAALLAQIQALQAQLSTAQGQQATSYNFTRDLTVGSKGADVKALQQFLNSSGYKIAASGAGSPGSETETFGSLTKAALAKYQAAVGLSPAAGYFGPKTRAYIASLAAAPTTPTTPGVTVPTGAALAVALASDTPGAKTLGSGTAFNPALKVNLTAGSAAVKVSSIKLQKGGFLANTNLNGVEILDSKGVRHGNVVTSVSSDNTVLITMATDPIVVAAGTTEKILVRFNLLSGNYTGTVSFAINAAADISSDAGSVTGTFPVSGTAMNIVYGGSALASTTLDVLTSTGSSTLNVDAASLQEITKFRIVEASSNEGVNLYSLTLYNYENAAGTDYKDVTLYAQDGTVLATGQPSDKTTVLTLTTPYFIDKGLTKDFTVKVKLINGTTRKLNFAVYNNYDIDLRGAATGVSLIPAAGPTNDTAFPIGNGFNIQTIGSGSLTLDRASDSPSSAVTPGATSVVLAKFTVKPTGEDMELRRVKFAITATSTALTGTVYVKVNGATVYSTAASNIVGGLGTEVTLSSYPILTAGQNSTITVETSIPSTAGSSDSYQVFNMDITQVKRLVTNDLTDPSVSAINGNNIAVSAARLAVTTLNTPVADSVVAGTNDFEFAQIQLNSQAGGEDVKVSKVRVTYTGHNTPNSTNLSNYRLYKDNDTTPLSTSASTASLSSDAGSATVDFNFSNSITVARSNPVVLHLKANVLTGAATNATSTFNVASSSAAYTAVGAITGNTVTPGYSGNTMTGNGQQMTVVAAGTLTLSLVSGSGASPSQNQVVSVGTTGQVYFAFKMTSQYETQKITSLKITATSTGAAQLSTTTLRNISLYEGNTLRKTVAQFDGCHSGGCWVTYTDQDNVLSAAVPTTGVTIYVKADVAAGGSAVLGNNFKFMIASSTGDVAVKGSNTASTSGTRTGTPTASGVSYVIPQNVKVEAVSPTMTTNIGLSAGNVIGVFKITNNGTAPIYLASSTGFTFTNGGSATNSLSFALYSSALGGSQGDTSVTYIATSTADGSSSSVPFDLTNVVAASRKIDGGSWRYLTIKNASFGTAMPGVPVSNNTFQFSVSALGNLLYNVDESDLGYSGNPQSDNDLSDTIPDLYIDGTPSLATVTAKT